MKFFIEHRRSEIVAYKREVDETELSEVVAKYIAYVVPQAGTITIGRIE
jgi:glutamate/tyrosine decarboxylase-like PLP-dependent enzyme